MRGGAELAEALVALLGPHARVAPLDDEAAALAVAREHAASRRAAEPDEWALVRREWPVDEAGACADTLHRLSRNLGARPAWLIVPRGEPCPHVVAIESDAALDNPFGFAALGAGRTPELALLDRDVAAGLRLARRTEHLGTVDVRTWELEVWGEPWLSAATRAFRGVG